MFTRQHTVHVPQRWQQTSDEMQRQIVSRINAALTYERIPEAPKEVIHWRMETLLNRRHHVSQNTSMYLTRNYVLMLKIGPQWEQKEEEKGPNRILTSINDVR
jgi:hypothetical protein